MDQAGFIKHRGIERKRFEELLGAVEVGRMDLPGVSGDYSTKDIVAHITACERALVRWLKAARAEGLRKSCAD